MILGLETSTHSGGAALLQFTETQSPALRPAGLVGSITFSTKQLYSQRLLPSIEWLLDRTQVAMADVSVVGVSLGPGSFTGLRIGLSVAKALAYASGAKIVGVGTLEALAVRASAGRDARVCCLLDAHHGQVYAGLYEISWQDGLPRIAQLRPDWAGPLEDMADWITEPAIFAGDALPLAKERLAPLLGANFTPANPHQALPHPEEVAVVTAARAAAGQFDNAIQLEPRYVRQSYTTPKPRQGL